MLTAVLLLLTAMTSIQLGAGLAKGLFDSIGAAGTSTLRLFFATLILWSVWRPWRTKLDRSRLGHLLIFGLALGLMNLLFYYAIARIPLGVAVALEFTGPLAVSVFNSKKLIHFLWAMLAAAGIYLLLPLAGSNLDLIGVCFALAAGFFWALYILYGQKAGKSFHGGLATTWGMTFAFLVVLPAGLNEAGIRLFSLQLLPLALAVAVLSSALPYSLEMVALKKLPARTFGVFMSIEPALAALAGWLVLGERLTHLQGLAVLLVIVSSFGSSMTVEHTDA